MSGLNLLSLAGIAVLLLIAFLFSSNKKKIRWKIVLIALLSEFVFAFLILHTGPGMAFFNFISNAIVRVLSFAYNGIDFVFGWLYSGQGIKDFQIQHAFILEALVPIVFTGSIIAVLYHYKIMQAVVRWISILFTKALGISSAESLATVSNVFLGQTQAPLVIAPYVEKLTESEFFVLMVSGMATVAGSLFVAYNAMGAQMSYVLAASIMAAPGAIIMAKIMIPETGTPETEGDKPIIEDEPKTLNFLDAIAQGATDGWKVTVGVAVMLLSFVSVIYLLNYAVGLIPGLHLSLNKILGWIFTPIAFVIGVPVKDIPAVATMLGKKTVFNEFIAYADLKGYVAAGLSPRAYLMTCFALTGFANFSSIAIQIGGIGEIAPGRRKDVAKLGFRAVLAAVLANLLSAAIAGVMFVR